MLLYEAMLLAAASATALVSTQQTGTLLVPQPLLPRLLPTPLLLHNCCHRKCRYRDCFPAA